jgi:hypothetical protein
VESAHFVVFPLGWLQRCASPGTTMKPAGSVMK